MRGRRIKYSDAQLTWLEANRSMVIGEYHHAFRTAFPDADVTSGHLHALRKRKGWKTGRDGRFVKGGVSWSKGIRRGNNPGSARTQFKKGHRGGVAAKVYKPIGTERVTKDGYLERKINDGMPLQARWRAVHLVRWEEINGPLPKGHALKSLDGNKLNTDPSNWELVPRGLLPRLNGKSGRNYDGAPAEMKPTIMAIAKLEHRLREKRRDDQT